MPTKYIVRVASNVPYEYWQAESDTFAEILEAEQELRELKGGVDVAQEKAISTLTSNGVRTSLPGLATQKPAAPRLGGGGQQQRQQYDDVELGKLDDGTVITVHPTGKYGPYVKARNIPGREKAVFANLPKGAGPEQIDLATAIGLIEQKMAA
jgi:topoisomerase IA-like protein